jgi:soluble lytic murein transglycosylase-like protein
VRKLSNCSGGKRYHEASIRRLEIKNLPQIIVSAIIFLSISAGGAARAQGEPDAELRAVLLTAVSEADSFPDRFEAEVWLTDMSARLSKQVSDPEERIDILTRVHYEASRVALPPELVLAVIEVESNFDRYAVSVAGALGLMQIMPFWLEEIGRPDDNLLHINTNLRYGCTILKYYLDKEKGDLRRALGRYNGSLGQRKYPNKVVEKLTRKWFRA